SAKRAIRSSSGIRQNCGSTSSGTLTSVTCSSSSSWQRPRDHGVGEEVVVAGAGDLVDGGPLSSVPRTYPHEVEPTPLERLLGAGGKTPPPPPPRRPAGPRAGRPSPPPRPRLALPAPR